MPIQVTCPGCYARFSVSDKYAGKKGPCPKCKKEIVVPDKAQEVVIHAPELTGPKDSKGVSILKPIKRKEFELTNLQLVITSGLALVTIIAAISARFAFDTVPWWYLALGVISLSYPVAWAGYAFLRDDELGGYFGKELAIRLAACSALFAVTWGLYWGLAYYLGNKSLAQVDGVSFAIFLAIMLGVGAFASLAKLGNGVWSKPAPLCPLPWDHDCLGSRRRCRDRRASFRRLRNKSLRVAIGPQVTEVEGEQYHASPVSLVGALAVVDGFVVAMKCQGRLEARRWWNR